MSAILLRTTKVTLLGIVCGCVVALIAVGFVYAVIWLNDILLISPRSRMLAGNGGLLTIMTLAVPALGGLVAGLLCQGIAERRPHGPADAIQSAQSLVGAMPVKSG
jgi:CIC family chloride channel protein